MASAPPIDVEALAALVCDGDRAALGRAITLVESTRVDHRRAAEQLLDRLLPATGGAARVGITGVPGVGKSTFIDALGTQLTTGGARVAVLAIDPSSVRTGGSILGDKTRMSRLSRDPNAFVRPSPTSGALGGVTGRTRETLLVCEAAGFDVILIETVGVGQSETTVARLTDFFLVLTLPGAGDELQGMKRGVFELADLICVNKADGETLAAAKRAAHDIRTALRFFRPVDPAWTPPVMLASALEETGVADVWAAVQQHREQSLHSGRLDARRRDQQRDWLWSLIREGLERRFSDSDAVREALAEIERSVVDGTLSALSGAQRLLSRFHSGLQTRAT